MPRRDRGTSAGCAPPSRGVRLAALIEEGQSTGRASARSTTGRRARRARRRCRRAGRSGCRRAAWDCGRRRAGPAGPGRDGDARAASAAAGDATTGSARAVDHPRRIPRPSRQRPWPARSRRSASRDPDLCYSTASPVVARPRSTSRRSPPSLEAGRPALVLVPEISMAMPLVDRLRADLDVRVGLVHSGLGDGERADEWRRIRAGDVDIVVGTRLAVVAPLVDIGVVIVDEEHDAAYKSDRTPRLQARDAAIRLGGARRCGHRPRFGDAGGGEPRARRSIVDTTGSSCRPGPRASRRSSRSRTCGPSWQTAIVGCSPARSTTRSPRSTRPMESRPSWS